MIFDDYLNTKIPIEKELNLLFSFFNNLIIFDIGACDGGDSIRYSRLFPDSRIYAFEPLPENFQTAEYNFEKYNINNINIFHFALSNKKSIEKFYISSGSPYLEKNDLSWNYGNKSSSLLSPKDVLKTHEWLKFNKTITVKTDTLKNFCIENNIKEIDFVHMDVQGAELMVLEGAADVLENIKVFWVEVSDKELYEGQPLRNDVEKFMKNNNFFKAKSIVDDISGDQLYINKKYFNEYIFKIRKLFKK